MQTTYRLKAKEISMTFLKSLKTMFKDQEVEITVKSVDLADKGLFKDKNKLLEMIRESRGNAPIISPDIDIRALIDESQYPDQ
jgi:hypothetical protein